MLTNLIIDLGFYERDVIYCLHWMACFAWTLHNLEVNEFIFNLNFDSIFSSNEMR